MQVIVTMGGRGARFLEAGYQKNKPFIPLLDRPIISYLVDQFPSDFKIIFALGDFLFSDENLKILKTISPNCKIVSVPYSERGPIDTVQAVLPEINLNKPVIVSYCDYTLTWNPENFLTSVQNYDAAIVGYQGFHPTYLGSNTYCHYQADQNNLITQIQEKKLFTDHLETEWTSCGLYYFKSGLFLNECLVAQEEQKLNYNGGEYYTSLALQAALNLQPQLKILNYQIQQFIQLGTPEDIERFKYWYEVIVLGNQNLKAQFKTDSREHDYWKNYFNYSISSR